MTSNLPQSGFKASDVGKIIQMRLPYLFCPTVLTPHTSCGKLAKRRNPDQDAHKDALLVNIQGLSLAAADLNVLGTGGCAWAEPILQGSALAFLTLGTLLNKKPQPVSQSESGVGWHAGHQVRHSQQPGRNAYILLT
jgi:hypothetical protein